MKNFNFRPSYYHLKLLMKIRCSYLCLIFVFLGCQENQAHSKQEHNKAIARDLNSKAEELLHSNPDSALTLLDSALKFNSEDYMLYFNRGHVYIGKGNYMKAIEVYKQMLLRKPDFTQGIIFLGMLYNKTGQSELAKLEYLKAIANYDMKIKNAHSNQTEDNINRIFALFLLDSASAKPQLEKLVQEDPQSKFLNILNNSSKSQIINGFLSK
jgi:tetratricopeptide (TPR) repeat protein